MSFEIETLKLERRIQTRGIGKGKSWSPAPYNTKLKNKSHVKLRSRQFCRGLFHCGQVQLVLKILQAIKKKERERETTISVFPSRYICLIKAEES